ncbi:MAG: Rrf2 family transcriptional regulator [Lentisphaerae bacterium]|nr:Rrf2 family transcriptional regulator [Lentisphaerota bacterium]
MLTRRAKYAMRALSHLARTPNYGPVLIADLATAERIPKKFLERILLELNRRGVLQSRKGRGGGYLLNRAPDQITIAEIVRAMDGPLAPVPCVSQTAYGHCVECPDERHCGIRAIMQEVRDAIAGILDKATLADLVQAERTGRYRHRA